VTVSTFSDGDFWNGNAQIGAALQYWNNETTIQTVQANLLDGDPFNGPSGHSIIFSNYTFDDNGNIDGFSYYDYRGYHTVIQTNWTATRLTVGTNLIDP
jgi:hypothetical protein